MNKQERLTFPCIEISQPIGKFFISSILARDLCEITWVDVRRIEDRDFENYLGIQRPLSQKRVQELRQYVQSPDACFPTAVIIAVPGVCASYDAHKKTMCLSPYENDLDVNQSIAYNQMAKVIDGQHRIEGLREYEKDNFEVNVSIFIDMDIADQAYLFSTVNLAQTKVNKSLVYDLFELARTRSPQKTCHEMAVALDRTESSPFFQRIKRLGVATEGRFSETITQATFVESIISYISENPMEDRNLYLNNKKPKKATHEELGKIIFRNMFIEKMDMDITDIVWNFFDAVHARWPKAWNTNEKMMMLNKTNGFKALIRFLRPAYLSICEPGQVAKKEEFLGILEKSSMKDDDFVINTYHPGTSGESLLYRTLLNQCLPEQM